MLLFVLLVVCVRVGIVHTISILVTVEYTSIIMTVIRSNYSYQVTNNSQPQVNLFLGKQTRSVLPVDPHRTWLV